jgi:hypothetical protein
MTPVPGDFESNGPHRLVLQTRVRTAGLTDSWEIEPAHIPFTFEFDPNLQLDAILTLPDANRDESVARAIGFEPAGADDGKPSTYLSLGGEWTLRNPPRLAVAIPLPCDLAHTISIEFEGVAGRSAGGRLTLSGQHVSRRDACRENSLLTGGQGLDVIHAGFELDSTVSVFLLKTESKILLGPIPALGVNHLGIRPLLPWSWVATSGSTGENRHDVKDDTPRPKSCKLGRRRRILARRTFGRPRLSKWSRAQRYPAS